MRIFLIVYILFSSGYLFAQENKPNPSIYGLRSHYGFIIPHSENLKDISQTNPWGFQLDWSKLMLSEKSWDNCNCYAQVGLSFEYFNYGNPDVLGNSYNFIYFAEPYFNFKKNLFFSFRAGVGATLLDKVYNERSNPENIFYSSTLSFLLLLNLNANYRINQDFFLSLSGNYNHISNGGMKQPNKGMNFPTVSLGLNYSPEFEGFPEREKSKDNKGLWQGYARLFGTLPGVDEGNGFEEKRLLLLGISGGALYYYTHVLAINAGIELVYDNALREEAERLSEDYGGAIGAFMLGNNIVFGRWTFNQQFGFYLQKPDHYTHHKVYQRYELLYRLKERFQLGTSLKAHGHVAENIDIRLGLLF